MSNMNTDLRSMEEETFMADVDVSECFLNFILHESLVPLAGLDITEYLGEVEKEGDSEKKIFEA